MVAAWRRGLLWGILVGGSIAAIAGAQENPPPIPPEAQQTAEILGIATSIAQLHTMQAQASCGAVLSPEERSLRQELSETIEASSIDVDGVLAEISNERNELGDLRASLQMRRDHTVRVLNAAALITGSGLGAAVSATQFTTLSSTTQNTGDGLGIGAGVASTILSFVAVRKQNGPKSSVGATPNMLAPLFGGEPVLHTYYPPWILRYLESVPAGQRDDPMSRLAQLKARWVTAGRIDSMAAKQNRTIATASTSLDPSVKVSITDLGNRMAMLGDLEGSVALIKRDLATLMRSYHNSARACTLGIQPEH